MAKRIQLHTFHLLFCLFSYLADKSGGWSMFVKPKLVIGALIIGVGLSNPEDSSAQQKYSTDDDPPPKQTKFFKDSTNGTEAQNEPFCYIIDQMPEFPGGMEEMIEFLSTNIKYPTEAVSKKIGGIVICQFIVNKQGEISNIKIIRGIDSLFDNEAIRVIKLMPRWNWSNPKTAPNFTTFTLPIRFTLTTKKK